MKNKKKKNKEIELYAIKRNKKIKKKMKEL